MDDSRVLTRLTHGTLHSLQRLEGLSHNASDEKESIAKQQRQLAALQKSLRQLMQQHDRLAYKLQHGPAKVLTALLKDEDADVEVTSEAEHAAVTSSLVFAKRLKTLEFLQAYRLSGVTVTNVSDRRIRVRWDTFYQGEYYEAYYMELEFKCHQLQVYRHTVPFFLPVTTITEAYLNQDLPCFVDEIADLLNAYVSRREQVAQLKRDHTCTSCLVGDVSLSQSLDFIQFTVLLRKQRNSQIHIDLYYDDLHTALPTRVCLTDTSDSSTQSNSLKPLESSLKQHELSKAISTAVCR